MTDMLLTFYCVAIDRDGVADALRGRTPAPLHLRDEQVLGRDFGDAGAGEVVRLMGLDPPPQLTEVSGPNNKTAR